MVYERDTGGLVARKTQRVAENDKESDSDGDSQCSMRGYMDQNERVYVCVWMILM